MAALLAEEIEARLQRRDESRLVIAPMLDPDEQLRHGQASVDVRLGSRFRLAETTTEGVIDTVRNPRKRVPKVPLYVPLGKSIFLHPHQFLLGETFEFIRLPRDLMAYVVGRSAWGRDGLIVATAVGVHPGFAGTVTLEFRNLGEVPIALYPGDLIAQLFLHEAIGEPEVPVGAGQFSGARGPIHGSHRSERTREKLERLARREPQQGATTQAQQAGSDALAKV